MMKELLQKYKDNTITHEELVKLREQLEKASDEELTQLLRDAWMAGGQGENVFTDTEVRLLKERIMEKVGPDQLQSNAFDQTQDDTQDDSTVIPSYTRMQRIALWAAAILLPIFICSTAYLYYLQTKVTEETIVFSTDEFSTDMDDRASLQLPDHSKVILNRGSKIAYRAGNFSKDKRTIAFNGEAYFNIAKDPRHPFIVQGNGYTVEVKGTKFNISDYRQDDEIVISLDEGVISLQTPQHPGTTMNAGHVAYIDKKTGAIEVKEETYQDDHTSWLRNEIVLRHATQDEMLATLSRNYDVVFLPADIHLSSKTFTGKLPSNNLPEALKIIEALYNVKMTVDKGTVRITR
jgi:transmembrane sensor